MDSEVPVETKEDIREALLTLSEAGKIRQRPDYIKKAGHNALVKIKKDYERKQLDEVNDKLSN